METQLVVVLAIVILITVGYRLLPYRKAGARKPFIAFFPKYKKTVKHSLTDRELEFMMSGLGFKSSRKTDDILTFRRGSVIGDISIKLAKINVAMCKIMPSEHEITVEAGWVAAFDTGDHWQFITELGEKIENA